MSIVPASAFRWTLGVEETTSKPSDPKDYNGYLAQKVHKLTRETNRIEDSLRQQDATNQQLQMDLVGATCAGEKLVKVVERIRSRVRSLTSETDRCSARCERLQREVKLKTAEVEEQLRGSSSERSLLDDATENAASVRESLHNLKEERFSEENRNDVAYRCLKADVWSVQRMLNAAKVETDALNTRTSELRDSLKLTASEREKLELELRSSVGEICDQERVNRDLAHKLQLVTSELGAARNAVNSRTSEVYNLHCSTRNSNANSHRLKESAQRKASELKALRSEVLGALTDIQGRQDALQDKIDTLQRRGSGSWCGRSSGSLSSGTPSFAYPTACSDTVPTCQVETGTPKGVVEEGL